MASKFRLTTDEDRERIRRGAWVVLARSGGYVYVGFKLRQALYAIATSLLKLDPVTIYRNGVRVF